MIKYTKRKNHITQEYKKPQYHLHATDRNGPEIERKTTKEGRKSPHRQSNSYKSKWIDTA